MTEAIEKAAKHTLVRDLLSTNPFQLVEILIFNDRLDVLPKLVNALSEALPDAPDDRPALTNLTEMLNLTYRRGEDIMSKVVIYLAKAAKLNIDNRYVTNAVLSCYYLLAKLNSNQLMENALKDWASFDPITVFLIAVQFGNVKIIEFLNQSTDLLLTIGSGGEIRAGFVLDSEAVIEYLSTVHPRQTSNAIYHQICWAYPELLCSVGRSGRAGPIRELGTDNQHHNRHRPQ